MTQVEVFVKINDAMFKMCRLLKAFQDFSTQK